MRQQLYISFNIVNLAYDISKGSPGNVAGLENGSIITQEEGLEVSRGSSVNISGRK